MCTSINLLMPIFTRLILSTGKGWKKIRRINMDKRVKFVIDVIVAIVVGLTTVKVLDFLYSM